MKVSILGTGTMGAPMARRIAERAFGEVTVWNRSREKAEPLAEAGCVVAGTIADAVSGADAVVVMLADGDAVLAVLGEALPALQDGAILVQTSTVGLDATEAIAARTAERGITLLDAPVIGSREPAEKGQLVVLASGPDEAIDRCGGIFEAIGRQTHRLGEAGAGTRLKLVVNSWIVSMTESLAETLALGESLAVEPSQFLDTIRGGPLDAKYAQAKGGLMASREFEPASFALSLAAKDARLALAAAARSDLDLPVLDAASRQMADAVEAGHGAKDMAAMFLTSCPAP